jgi:hypothetical protein
MPIVDDIKLNKGLGWLKIILASIVVTVPPTRLYDHYCVYCG